jgi:hypothetical protein
VPDSVPPSGARELPDCAAIRLFVERANSADPHFELTDDNASSVTVVCQRLDGLLLSPCQWPIEWGLIGKFGEGLPVEVDRE